MTQLSNKVNTYDQSIQSMSEDISNIDKKVDDNILVPGSILYGGNSEF
jgi:hypothetical protein